MVLQSGSPVKAEGRRLLPPHWFLLAVVLEVVLSFIPTAEFGLAPLTRLVGIVPMALGLAVMLWANQGFLHANTTKDPFGQARTLVEDGPYRFSRNPMYLGFVLILVGGALGLAHPLPWLVVPFFVALIQTQFIRHEETQLQRQFGNVYARYCARVRPWL